MSVDDDLLLLVDGKLRPADGGRRFDSIDPATERATHSVPDGTSLDMDEAIAAARRAFDTTDWATDRAFRRRCLEQLQAALQDQREELRSALLAEVGAPLMTTYGAQLDVPLEHAIAWPAAHIDRFPWERDAGEAMPFGQRTHRVVRKEPVGVVGGITPWNYPIEILLTKVGAVLASGNTLVVKPAPDSPFTALMIATLAHEHTDIPPGVLNIVTASDHAVGEQLVDDPRVDAISFTGSTPVGRRIMERAAPNLKRLFLELGGKSASIVLDDVDVEQVAFGAAMGACMHAGQGCAMLTRLLLPASVYDQGIEALAEAFRATKVGAPSDPSVVAGPLINQRQHDRVLGYVAKGIVEGARLIVGGRRPAGLDRGFFVEPTLFADVESSMTIAQEEIFGPVLVVLPYTDDDDAVRIANDSPYGLSGAVTSASEERALAVASRIRTGMVNVNGGIAVGPDMPFGGYRASGLGRQGADEGFEQYLETKSIGLGVRAS